MTGDLPQFADWLAQQLGTRLWCVASRTTPKLREKYETVLTPRIFRIYKNAHAAEVVKQYGPKAAS